MPHPSDAMLIACADEALDADAALDVLRHVADCRECAGSLRELREAMAGVRVEVALVDASEPPEWMERRAGPSPDKLLARAAVAVPDLPTRAAAARGAAIGDEGVGAALDDDAAVRRPFRIVSGGALRWAAVLAVMAGGGAAAMTGGLRWPGASATGVGLEAIGEAAAVDEPSSVPATTRAAVAVAPAAGEVVVTIELGAGVPSPARETRVVVRIVARPDVQATVVAPLADREGETPRFRAGSGTLDVQLAGTGSVVELEVPATLRLVRVVQAGADVVRVERGAVTPSRALTGGVTLPVTR